MSIFSLMFQRGLEEAFPGERSRGADSGGEVPGGWGAGRGEGAASRLPLLDVSVLGKPF